MEWRETDASGPVVVAVVWTCNRFSVVSDCIAALHAQTLVLDRIIVADSASPDDSVGQLRDILPVGDVVELPENEGMGAAIAAALRAAERGRTTTCGSWRTIPIRRHQPWPNSSASMKGKVTTR